MSTTETDLKAQLEDLDWGVPAAGPTPVGADAPEPQVEGPLEQASSPDSGDVMSALDTLDTSVAGVKPARVRKARKPRVVRQPNAQALLDAARGGDTVAAHTPPDGVVGSRRGRNEAPEVLVRAGEGPAVIALFDAMWKDVGSKLARSIGRAKASRQDAAIGWYALLLAMRERDAKK